MNGLLLSSVESLSFVINKWLFFDCSTKYWYSLELEEEILNVLMATLISFLQVHVLDVGCKNKMQMTLSSKTCNCLCHFDN